MPRTGSVRTGGLVLGAGFAAVVVLGGCASVTPGTAAADRDSIAQRASVIGISPDLVYTTEVDGYDLAPQSVGPAGTDGMSATWFDPSTAAMITIRTDRGEMTAESCAETPLWDAIGGSVACTDEDGIWHRSGGDVHEYVATRDGASILVIGVDNTPPADLLAAAKAVRVPSERELGLLFSDVPETPPSPVERGDLPENGDGAPIDPVGPGG